MQSESLSEKTSKTPSRWRILSLILAVFCIVLVIYVCILYYMRGRSGLGSNPEVCHGIPGTGRSDLSEPSAPHIFHSLTTVEIQSIKEYLSSNPYLNITVNPKFPENNNSAFLYDLDLYLPPKADVVNFLDVPGATRPDRAAVVTVFRKDKVIPCVEEYTVSPTLNPHHLEQMPDPRPKSVPFPYRLVYRPEMEQVEDMLKRECHKRIRMLLLESFGGTTLDCGDTCLVFKLRTKLGPFHQEIGEDRTRKFWFWLTQSVEHFALNPVNFAILVDMQQSVPRIHKVWYNTFKFDSLVNLQKDYDAGSISKIKIEFPLKGGDHFSNVIPRGVTIPKLPQRPPLSLEPDGKRYTIKHQEVTYMNWNFHFRMSNTHGPQLYDIKYLGNRIVYELGLQDILVRYSGQNPTHKFGSHFGSMEMIGWQTRGLVPGIDCPERSSFVDSTMIIESKLHKRSDLFCVFEQNTEYPLRTYLSKTNANEKYFEGAPNAVLVLRSIVSIYENSYVIDFIFFETGTLQTRVMISGFVLPTQFTKGSIGGHSDTIKYGLRIHDQIIGNIRKHFFNFKVDLDIGGVCNKFQTLTVESEKERNQYSKIPNDNWIQEKMRETTVQSEKEVLNLTGPREPVYQIFLSNSDISNLGNAKSYRLFNPGCLRGNVPSGENYERLAPWTTRPLYVTKHKDTERHSSSKYAAFDESGGVFPGFATFYGNDERIVGEVSIFHL